MKRNNVLYGVVVLVFLQFVMNLPAQEIINILTKINNRLIIILFFPSLL